MKKGIYIALGVLFGLAVIGAFVEDDPKVSNTESAQYQVDELVESAAAGSDSSAVESVAQAEDEPAPQSVPNSDLSYEAANYEAWLNNVKELNSGIEYARNWWWNSSENDHEALSRWGEYAQQFRVERERLEKEWQEIHKRELIFKGMSSEPLGWTFQMWHAVAFRKYETFKNMEQLYKESVVAAEQFIQEHK